MLSTQVIKNAGSASHYFLGQDNYYTQDQSVSQECSQWFGRGADMLGLSGTVESETFTHLLAGKLPSGQQVGKVAEGHLQHRPGFDLTFSAPKSVSLLALLGGDTRIISAVERATTSALNRIEHDLATARITQSGKISYQATQNLVIARFLHDISRAGDPQLHTHCVVMNMTQRPDGHWRSLASQSGSYGSKATAAPQGFFEAVRHHKKYYGTLFRAELAYEMQQLGYEILKQPQGFFEIAGISAETLQAFSQRRKAIEQFLKTEGLSGAKAAALATLKTRTAKLDNSREDLWSRWQSQAEQCAAPTLAEIQTTVTQAQKTHTADLSGNTPSCDPTAMSRAEKALSDAIAHLSEHQTVLRETAILHTALQYTLSAPVSTEVLLQTFKTLQQNGVLIAVENPHPVLPTQTRSESFFTTAALVQSEKKLLQATQSIHVSQQPLLKSSDVSAHWDSLKPVIPECHFAIQTLCASPHSLIFLDTDHNRLCAVLPTLGDLARLTKHQAIFLTPSRAQQIVLDRHLSDVQTDTGWFSNWFHRPQFATVTGFLHQHNALSKLEIKLQKRPLLLVAHAEQLPIRQLQALVQYTERSGGRLLLASDASAARVNPFFHQLMQHGASQVKLKPMPDLPTESAQPAQSQAQSQSQSQRQSQSITTQDYTLTDPESRYQVMATQYAQLSLDQQQQTHVILPTRARCEAMNAAIRQALLEQGKLSGESVSITTLQPHRLSATAQRYAVHYQVGQWIRFQTDSLSLRVRQGGYRQIVGLDVKSNTVQLAHPKNPERIVHWNPARTAVGKISIFTPQVREIAPGESIIWRHTDQASGLVRGLVAGRVFTVEKIGAKQIILQALDDSSAMPLKLRLNRTQLSHRHFEYAYATLPRQTRLQPCTLVMRDASDSNSVASRQPKRLDPEFQPNLAQWSDTDSVPLSAIRHAIAHLSEREAAFSSVDLIQTALQKTLGAVSTAQLEQALQQAEAQGELVRGQDSSAGIRWTTPAALAQERELLQLARSHSESNATWFSAATVTHYLAQTPDLSREQRDTLQQFASIRSGLVLIQGYAGTRKTSLLQHIQSLLHNHSESSSKSLLCLTPTHTAAQECRARGLSAQTLDSFLNTHRHITQAPTLLVVDESSMVSTQKMLQILQYTQQTNTRVLLLGDIHQYPAIEAGKPFALLQQAGITTLQLTDITRQTNSALKALVTATYQRDFAGVLQKLGNSAIEIPNENGSRHARLLAIQHDYLNRDPERRAQTAIITFGNAERIEQNALIRTALKARGELTGKTHTTSVLVPKVLSHAEQQDITHYQCGDVLRFETAAINPHPNRYWQIQSIDIKNNVLSLACYGNADTTQPAPMLWQPGKAGVEVYQIQNREIQQGDLIRFTHSQANLKIFSAELAKVTAITPETITLRPITLTGREPETTGSPITLHPQQARYQHWDHAYAMTGYSAQGKTIREVIIHAESYRPQLTSQPSFLVALTRAVEAVTLYTDNKTALIQALENQPGIKTSALESLGLYPKSLPSNSNSPNHPSNPALEKALDKGIELEL